MGTFDFANLMVIHPQLERLEAGIVQLLHFGFDFSQWRNQATQGGAIDDGLLVLTFGLGAGLPIQALVSYVQINDAHHSLRYDSFLLRSLRKFEALQGLANIVPDDIGVRLIDYLRIPMPTTNLAVFAKSGGL